MITKPFNPRYIEYAPVAPVVPSVNIGVPSDDNSTMDPPAILTEGLPVLVQPTVLTGPLGEVAGCGCEDNCYNDRQTPIQYFKASAHYKTLNNTINFSSQNTENIPQFREKECGKKPGDAVCDIMGTCFFIRTERVYRNGQWVLMQRQYNGHHRYGICSSLGTPIDIGIVAWGV